MRRIILQKAEKASLRVQIEAFCRKISVAVAWMLMPVMSYADLPHPTYVYRLRRIGYEVLSESSGVYGEYGHVVDWFIIGPAMWIAILALLIGLWLLLILRFYVKKTIKMVWGKKNGKSIEGKVRFPSTLRKCIGAMMLISIVGIVILPLFSERFKTRRFIVSGPGWYYPDELPEEEERRIEAKISEVLPAVRNALNENKEYVISAIEWSSGTWQELVVERISKEKVLLDVIKSRPVLQEQCKGIPIIWLVYSTFKTYSPFETYPSPNVRGFELRKKDEDNGRFKNWKEYYKASTEHWSPEDKVWIMKNLINRNVRAAEEENKNIGSNSSKVPLQVAQ